MSPQELSDREELRDLVMRYCRGVDRRDFALVRSLYWDDAMDDHGEMFSGSPDDYVAWLPGVLEPLDCTIHAISNSLFIVDGDTAEGEHYSYNFHRTREAPRQEIIIHGRYLDRYERRDGVWKFSRRQIIFDHGYVQPVKEDGLSQAGADAPHGSDTHDDPSWSSPLLAGLVK
ncbi:MAG: nuclear transport factor 2 family protein [Parasphingorhabdus sp.]